MDKIAKLPSLPVEQPKVSEPAATPVAPAVTSATPDAVTSAAPVVQAPTPAATPVAQPAQQATPAAQPVAAQPSWWSKTKTSWNRSRKLSPQEQTYADEQGRLGRDYLKAKAVHYGAVGVGAQFDDGDEIRKVTDNVGEFSKNYSDSVMTDMNTNRDANAASNQYRTRPGGIREFIIGKKQVSAPTGSGGMYNYVKY